MTGDFFAQELKSSSGQNYIGLKIKSSDISPYLEQLKGIVSLDDYILLTNKQKIRDNERYHLTLISPSEYQTLSEHELKDIYYTLCDLTLLGLGVAHKGGLSAYYVVSHSYFGDKIREKLRLPKKDFHITIGFNESDIHGVIKDSTTIIIGS